MIKENSVSVRSVRWGVGVAVTLLIFIASSLWAVSSAANGRAGDLRVLEARINNLENTVLRISESASSISNSVTEIKASQASFQAALKSDVSYLKEKIQELKKRPGRH